MQVRFLTGLRLPNGENVTIRVFRVSAIALAFLIASALPLISQSAKEPSLSAGEARVIDHAIETMRSESDRKVAREWSNSKKVAEVICRPAATSYWKKAAGTDRVFLGTSDPTTLVLVSDHKLAGSGQYRTAKGWTDFQFVCELNPDRGRVTHFEAIPMNGEEKKK